MRRRGLRGVRGGLTGCGRRVGGAGLFAAGCGRGFTGGGRAGGGAGGCCVAERVADLGRCVAGRGGHGFGNGRETFADSGRKGVECRGPRSSNGGGLLDGLLGGRGRFRRRRCGGHDWRRYNGRRGLDDDRGGRHSGGCRGRSGRRGSERGNGGCWCGGLDDDCGWRRGSQALPVWALVQKRRVAQQARRRMTRRLGPESAPRPKRVA